MVHDADRRQRAAVRRPRFRARTGLQPASIIPLATERDALTQIPLGIADFQHRFGRRPEGMWLAETAVSTAAPCSTSHGPRRHPLHHPRSASVRPCPPTRRTPRPLRSQRRTPWHTCDTPNATVDPRHPYLIRLDEGRSIAIFFYDLGPSSLRHCLRRPAQLREALAKRLLHGLDDRAELAALPRRHRRRELRPPPQARRGDGALSSHALDPGGGQPRPRFTNYAEFLDKFPPTMGGRSRRFSRSSWSCAPQHRALALPLAGCSGGKPGCHQEWRTPLRDAFDEPTRRRTAPLVSKPAPPAC